MATTHKPSTLCLWCNGLLEWGDDGIEYDLCERCVPSVIESLHARLASEPAREWNRPSWERALAAAL
jgi:hypothetical protein